MFYVEKIEMLVKHKVKCLPKILFYILAFEEDMIKELLSNGSNRIH